MGLSRVRARVRDVLAGSIARGSIGSLAMRILSVLLALASTVLLARVLGVDGFGLYGFALAVSEILLIPAMLGIPNLLRREIPRGLHERGAVYVRRLVGRSFLTVFGVANGIAILTYSIAFGAQSHLEPGALLPLGVALVLLPLHALCGVGQGGLAGLGRVVSGQVPLMAVRPTVVLLVLLAIYWLSIPLTPAIAVAISLLGVAIAFVVAARMMLRHLPRPQQGEASPRVGFRSLLKAGLPFTLIAGFGVLNNQADVVMLGILSSAQDTGLYRVAHRIASTAAFPYAALAMALSPAVAGMFARGELAALRYRSVMASRYAVAGALAICTVLLVFSGFVLGLFGEAFLAAEGVLQLLCLGQLVMASLFAVQTVLAMTGHEKLVARNFALGAVLNIVLNIVLIPRHGMEGAAFASVFSSFVLGLVMLLQVRTTLNFYPIFFSRLRSIAE